MPASAPSRAVRPRPAEAGPRAGWALPAWTYEDPGFFALEREHVFAPSWQIVCHRNDVPEAGDYVTLDLLGETVFVVRGADGAVRAFHNVCRHRAARLLDGDQGNCGDAIACPYHAWRYALDGRLTNVPYEATFEDFDRAEHGLVAVEHEVWLGFVFVRLAGGGPSVAEILAPYDDEIAPYRFEAMQPLGRVSKRLREVNWKNGIDNYCDGMHIPVAHGGLTRLFGNSYRVEVKGGVHHMRGELREKPSANWSERAYQALLPPAEHLPPARRRLWAYYRIFPNIAFDVYPDQIDFMQFLPLTPTRTLIREIAYALTDERREMRLARYLNWRINRNVSLEDKDLIERVQHGMRSRSYVAGPLSREEVCLRDFAETVRRVLPVACLPHPPEPGAGARQAARQAAPREVIG